MTPYEKSEKIARDTRGHLIVALLWLIHGRGVILMSFGVVYWLINANKPRQYRLFVSLKILKTGIFCAD